MSVFLSSFREDFRRAHQRAALQALLARMSGRSIDLLSFDEVRRRLQAGSTAERGLQDIPVAAIIGTVGRTTDFTRDFLPRESSDEVRWARVAAANQDMALGGLPPIDVYKIGDAFFVKDGHHRVSVARENGQATIQANVTEVMTSVPFTSATQPADLILKSEYAEFLSQTELGRSRPEVDLTVSTPGQYDRLLDFIHVHRYFKGRLDNRPLTLPEAAESWLDEAYLPVVMIIRDHGVLRDYPDQTETDLYIWLVDHTQELRQALGWDVPPSALATALAEGYEPDARPGVGRRILKAVVPNALEDGPATGVWRRAHLERRYVDRLFPEILVPISGSPTSWRALEQAIVIAKREKATLFGLHVGDPTNPGAQAHQAEFRRMCVAAGVPGQLAVEDGDVTDKICQRAALADLVVLNLAFPPGPRTLDRLSSGFSAIVRRCPRPLLAVPETRPVLDHVLLAFDGSAKAREALFICAYLAGAWGSRLTVLTVEDGHLTGADAVQFAHQYLEFHEVEATFVSQAGQAAEVIAELAAAEGADIVAMGGYGRVPLLEVVVGSVVNRILPLVRRPVLICR